ncbi:MerR family transcriptional regulator [Alkalicoccobacillus porphyridii]|uniref:MerR family transcriptional regulator n=1 Tax=Alkalicoccobacillus porphyridii TaxID=2597270 RepID=A0A553ZWT8_9BACI|nr:MerR family transcriptional regulator [Alkalicoccobacillus porphyridii]TSB45927.1 MerR family transcriptional regulator [Alkalicoccobacillus porphyridii]
MYSIAEVSKITGLTTDTVRYYEKIDLLPPIRRKTNGHSIYSDTDLQTFLLINCLKKTGLSLVEIKPFLSLSMDTNIEDHPELEAMISNHKNHIEHQIAELQKVLDFIEVFFSKKNTGEHCHTQNQSA